MTKAAVQRTQSLSADRALERYKNQINRALAEHVQSVDKLPDEVRMALQYTIAVGGKRIRPTIALLACESVGGSARDALHVAVAAELLHTATLIYDDIIDGDKLRRGQPAVHVKFGQDLAIVVAGMLTTRALYTVMEDTRLLRHILSAMDELGVGEVLDIRGEIGDVKGYLLVSEKKTATLFRLAADMGALMGNATPAQQTALGDYAHNLGAAFQLRDDVLNAVGDQKQLGKPVGSDLRKGRPSIVSILVCEHLDVPLQKLAGRAGNEFPGARTMRRLVSRAAEQAMVLCNSYVGQAANALQMLPDSVHRENMHHLLRSVATRSR